VPDETRLVTMLVTAFLTLLNTLVLAWSARKVAQVHGTLNTMQKTAIAVAVDPHAPAASVPVVVVPVQAVPPDQGAGPK
jgi:hypothetical protein